MKKMIKECTINLYVRKTNVLAEDSSYTHPYNAFHGDKNEVMRYLRKFLIKNLDFSIICSMCVEEYLRRLTRWLILKS